jgi:hypothetical protein
MHSLGTIEIANNLGVFDAGSLRKELLADETPVHVVAEGNEHLADLVGACVAGGSLCRVICTHCL